MLCYLHRNNICNLSCVAKQMPCYLCRILWQNYIFLMHLTKKNLCVLPIFWRKACSNWFSFFGQCLVEIEKQVFEVQVLKKRIFASCNSVRTCISLEKKLEVL